MRAAILRVLGLALALALCLPAQAPARLRVAGIVLRDGARTVRLLGVNRSGPEYMCLDGYGDVFDGPSDTLSIARMASWHINAVRVPLNESCWLGRDGVVKAGPAYRRAIRGYVRRLHAAGLYVILDDHVATAGGAPARSILPLPDAAEAPAFWRSVAKQFRHDGKTVFDLYNEPHDVSWKCWRDGCTVPAGTAPDGGGGYPAYRAAGMQRLVSAVRSAGAPNPLMLGGLSYSLDISGWLEHEPHDSRHALIASFHTYGPVGDPGGAPCEAACRAVVAHVARRVPVVAGEIGEYDCAHGYIDDLMPFLDAHGISYLGWTWDAVSPGGWQCGGGPSLIDSYDGTPTAFGIGLRDHLALLAHTLVASSRARTELRSAVPRAGANTHLGLALGTSPSIAALPGGGYAVAFQANTGVLWTYSAASGARNLGLAMRPGTSPSIAALPGGGYVIAFQASSGVLWTYSTGSGARALGLGMGAGSSPSIVSSGGDAYVVAFQASTDDLWDTAATSPHNLGLAMAAGSSPSIVPLAGGRTYVIAFQGSSGALWTVSSASGSQNLALGMRTGSSPSIAALPGGGYVVAFQANMGGVWTYSSATGARSLGRAMQAGSSPSIAALPGDGYELAYQALSGELTLIGSAVMADTHQPMMPGTSPSIAAPAGGGYAVAFQASTGELVAPYQYAPSMPAPAPARIKSPILYAFRQSVHGTRVSRLKVADVPAAASVEVRCDGRHRGCPFRRRKVTVRHRTANAAPLLKGSRLERGAVLEIRITAPARVGKVGRFTVRRYPKLPAASKLCVPAGSSRARKHC